MEDRLPPVATVPVVARCRSCGQPFRGSVCWRPNAPAYRRNRCPWCGSSQLLDRHGS